MSSKLNSITEDMISKSTEYSNFLNNLKSSSISVELLLDTFEEYLSILFIENKIINENFNIKNFEDFKTLKDQLISNIDVMLNFFDDIKFNKYENYNKILYLLLSATIILYQYIYITSIKYIDKFIDVITVITDIINKHKNIYDFIFNEFVNSIHAADIKKDFESILIYLQYKLQSPVICFKGDYIVLNSYITKIINIMKNYKKISIENNFITIFQYQGICWFTSFLTGICYSDYNKKLLLDKFDTNKTFYRDIKTDISEETNPRILLTSFVYNVIKYITYDFKKHNDYKETNEDCIIQLYLKEMPIKIIISFYNYFLSNHENIPKYFIQLQTRNKNEQLTFEDITNKKIVLGMSPKEQVEVFTIFYKFLNITLLPIYKDNINLLWVLKTDIKDHLQLNYDILILYDKLDSDKDKYKKISILTNYIDFKCIITNPFKFKFNLDYLVQGSDPTQKCSIFGGCGHCISAIQYNKEQYIHNTNSLKDFKTCNNFIDISISCDLMKTDWIKYLNNPEHTYTVNCTYYKIRPELNLHKFNFRYLDYFGYKFTNDAMYCYVKEDKDKDKPTLPKKDIIETLKGGTKKIKYLININKNLIFIIYNKKKQVIYIENNKLYLLIDKKPLFINKKQLSTKNGEYYIKI
jgi:hypothetical protein